MRILTITDRVPYPADSGASLRVYNLLRQVAQEHQMWLAAFSEPGQDEGIAKMREFCEGVETAAMPAFHALAQPLEMIRYLLNSRPPDIRFYSSAALSAGIGRLLAEIDFDVVQIEHAHMGLWLEALPPGMRSRTAWTLHDVDWIKFAQIARLESSPGRKARLRLHSLMMRLWEPRFAGRFGCSLTMSEADRQLLLGANPRVRAEAIPNGVDTRRLQPLPSPQFPPAALFVGDMGYPPNADAALSYCEEMLPTIRQAVPEVETWIVGMNPPAKLCRLDGWEGVHVTGRVEDVRPYYRLCSICVVPLRAGSGTRLKILEAMALCRPVVSTPIGCQGLEMADGEHLLVAQEPGEFATKAVLLLRDEALRCRIARRARNLVEASYDWAIIARKLIRVYEELASERKVGRELSTTG